MTPSSPSPRQWPAILALIIALGGGTTAAAFAFANQITQNPWRATAIAVVYLLGVFVVGAVAEIWQRLKVPWLDQAARWVDHALRRRFSGYPHRYRRFLIERHRFFDVKGLTTQGPHSLMLEQVFVELSLAPQPAHLVARNPIAISADLKEGHHSIWAYLQAEPLRRQTLAALGPPGSGKTTLLRHIALVLASERPPPLRRVPILLFLRHHAAAIVANPQLTLTEVIRDHLIREDGPLPPPGWFERLLHKRRCVIMLDGLDEVANLEQRQQVAAWVERQTAIYADNRFIVTSRPFGFRSTPLERATVLEVRTFTAAQMARFVGNWYLANEIMSARRDDAGVRQDARRGAEDLLIRLRASPNLAKLAVNPLLLTMIANVHRFSSSLPERRVELYREICVVFLGKRRQAHSLALDLTPAQKQRVLQPLAYAMMVRQVREITLAEILPLIHEPLERVSQGLDATIFLQQIEESSGILLEREHRVYQFAHLTFQEYLAATHIIEQGLEDAIIEHISAIWWHETILLYVAQTDATRIVDACLARGAPSIEALTLAIDCNAEAREIHPGVRRRLESLLIEGVEDADPERRRLIAEALLARRLRGMVRLDDRRAFDPSLISNAEYQLFIDEQAAYGEYHQPDYWPDIHFPAHQGRAPVLGMRPSDAVAFCAWLTERSGRAWTYRLLRADELPRDENSQPQRSQSRAGLGCWSAEASDAYLPLSSVSPVWPREHIQQRFIQDYNSLMSQLFTSFYVFGLAFSRASDRINARDSASNFIHALTLSLSSTHASVLALASALATDSVLARARDQSTELARWLARARDHSSDLARDHSSSRASALASALDLARASSLNLAGALSHARNRTLARSRVLDLAQALASVSERARDLVHARDLVRAHTSTHAGNLVRDLTRASARARDLVGDLAHDRVSADDRDRAITLAHDLVSISAVASELISSNANVFVSALIQLPSTVNTLIDGKSRKSQCNLDRHCNANPPVASAEALLRIHHHEAAPVSDHFNFLHWISPLTFDAALVLVCRRNPIDASGRAIDKASARRAIRGITLLVIAELQAQRTTPSLVRQLLHIGNNAQTELERLLAAYCEIYMDFAILEERVAGTLPPCEGILLVRELAEPDALTALPKL